VSHDLKLERLLDGTPDEVFEAFTDADAMLEWYQDNAGWVVEVLECDVRVGGTTTVSFGSAEERYVEVMTYTQVESGRRLAQEMEQHDGVEAAGNGDENVRGRRDQAGPGDVVGEFSRERHVQGAVTRRLRGPHRDGPAQWAAGGPPRRAARVRRCPAGL